jgi:Flp pilus assembly protein TadD
VKAYQTAVTLLRALELDKSSIAAIMNLADLYRSSDRDHQSLALLKKAKKISPQAPSVHYALGLAYFRKNGKASALPHFKKAAELAPQISHYSYTYALALDSAGKREQALAQLKSAYQGHPHNRDLATSGKKCGKTEFMLILLNDHLARG